MSLATKALEFQPPEMKMVFWLLGSGDLNGYPLQLCTVLGDINCVIEPFLICWILPIFFFRGGP